MCSAHGVRGVLKIEHWCDSARVLAGQKCVYLSEGGKYVAREVITSSASGQFVLMSIAGVSSREDAQAMKGKVLYLKREDIPISEGAVFIADMIDLPLIDVESGDVLGIITEKGEVIFPGIPEFVKEIDIERGVFVRTIPGFFD